MHVCKSSILRFDTIFHYHSFAANSGNLEEALKTLDNIIEESPDYPSAFNNRAQIQRILKRDEDALKDLDIAIKLSHEKGLWFLGVLGRFKCDTQVDLQSIPIFCVPTSNFIHFEISEL